MPVPVKRPKFSAPTKLVLAELDTEMPFDKQRIREMVEKRLVIPVAKHPMLKRRFEEAGYTPRQYANLYAIPFRKPGEHPLMSTLHARSIHTINSTGDKQFVFKGTGLMNSQRSFMLDSHETLRERRFKGGARIEGIKPVVEILADLEATYKKAKAAGDPVLEWAEKEHGISELPVMKHVAVFRPLQYLRKRYFGGAGKKARHWLDPNAMAVMKLGEFHPSVRVHAYTAREPTRIGELWVPSNFLGGDLAGMCGLAGPIRTELTQAKKAAEEHKDLKPAHRLMQQFIARAIVLLHIGKLAGVSFPYSTQSGSLLTSINVSFHEFFDFDTAEKDHRGNVDYESLSDTIAELAVNFLPHPTIRAPRSELKLISAIMKNVVENASLTNVQKKKQLSERVSELALDNLKHASAFGI